MTASNDLDRQLAAYLDDGPRRAPDRVVDAAVAHAAAHPRRRDPLLAVRRDVMAPRHAAFSPQLAWAALIVVLTLGAVAALAIGSRQEDRPIVVPPSVVVTPSASPSTTPAPTTFSVEVTDESGNVHPLEIVDQSGTVVDAAAGAQLDDSLGQAAATNDPGDPRRVHMTWPFASCADPVTVTVDGTARQVRLERPVCEGDALGQGDHVLILTFADPVDATQLDVELVEVP